MPCLARSLPVTRVSSAAVGPTSPSTRSARAPTSSRLPIGVPTTYSLLTSYVPEGSPPPPRGWARPPAPSPPQPVPNPVRDLRSRADESRGRRQDVKECLPVVAAQDAVVQDDHGAAIGRAPDQASESLLQSQRRLRQREL